MRSAGLPAQTAPPRGAATVSAQNRALAPDTNPDPEKQRLSSRVRRPTRFEDQHCPDSLWQNRDRGQTHQPGRSREEVAV